MGLFNRKSKAPEEKKSEDLVVEKAVVPKVNSRKRLVVACGSGVATSQTIASKISTMLDNDGINYAVDAVDYKHIEQELPTASIYVYIAQPDADVLEQAKKLNVAVFPGVPFLTGMGMDNIYQQIVALTK